ncbi:MAG: hypothetical protein IKE74_10240 [Mogibacterium sp.]|nr:hypothetical protein [Mogibacterium sp.]
MSESLEGLHESLSNIRDSLNHWKRKRQAYLDKAEEIRKVYDRLKKDKDTIQGYKKTVRSYSGKQFTDFKGSNCEYRYKPEIENLLNSYDTVIRNIDINLDRLNDEILRQKNLASDCLGPIGSLGKAFHTVQTKIENWAN